MIITRDVFNKIMRSYPRVPPEMGGILGRKNGIICNYFHDKGVCDGKSAVYEPTIDLLNNQIALWSEIGISFAGIIHSHLDHETNLSAADIKYIEKIISSLPQDYIQLYFPIIFPGRKRMISYLAERNNHDIIIRNDIITIKL